MKERAHERKSEYSRERGRERESNAERERESGREREGERLREREKGSARLVGSLKLYVSFAKEPYKRDYFLPRRPIILRSLLIVATP